MFTDTEFMTGADKQLVLKQWRTFLRSGLQRKQFSKRLYKHLTLNCSFIAHYDIDGFYATYFVQGRDVIRFLSQFITGGAGGATWWLSGEYADINKAMCEMAQEYAPSLLATANNQQRNDDLSAARVLLWRADSTLLTRIERELGKMLLQRSD